MVRNGWKWIVHIVSREGRRIVGALRGKTSHTFTDNETGEVHFTVTLDVEVPDGGKARALGFTIAMEDDRELTGAHLVQIGKLLSVYVDQAAAYLVAQAATQTFTEGTLRIGSGDSQATYAVGPEEPVKRITVRPGADFTEDVFKEMQRRRKARHTDEDYQRVADVYRDAAATGRSVQRAVADAMVVEIPTAARLISECRKRGLLPPTSKGKAKA